MFIHFYLVYVRHFLDHIIVFVGPFWRPLWPSALDSRLYSSPNGSAGTV